MSRNRRLLKFEQPSGMIHSFNLSFDFLVSLDDSFRREDKLVYSIKKIHKHKFDLAFFKAMV